MNEGLSIGTGTVRKSDVSSVSASNAGENIDIDVKHLPIEPENVAKFREQLSLKTQPKETGNATTVKGETKHDTHESPVLKHSAKNERNFFGNSDRHTPSPVSGETPRPSQNQSTDGSRKDFHEKSMKFDINSQSPALKTAGGAVTSNVTHGEYVTYKAPFFEAPDIPQKPVNNPKELRNTFTGTGTLPSSTPLRNIAGENEINFRAGVSQSDRDLPQPLSKLKSPATLFRELQTPTASTETRTSEVSVTASTSISAKTSEAIAKEPSSGVPSAETLHTPENRVTLHSTTSSVSNFSPSPTDAFSKDGTTASVASTRSSDGSNTVTNAHATKSTENQTRERPRLLETPSEPHKTAVIDTIPFLRTANEIIAPVQDPTAAQTSKSHAILIAQRIRDHIIDRILVSSSALNTHKTVTVQLSPRLLQDTEVQFTQNGTSLDIRLVSQNKDSVQFLQQHQSDLQTYLQGELKTYRAVSVRVPSSQTSAELSQPHDGRSRNRFDYQSADEEETT